MCESQLAVVQHLRSQVAQVESEAVIALLIHVNAQLCEVLKIQIKVKFNDISCYLEMHQVRHVY